jgi:hypothetical protein
MSNVVLPLLIQGQCFLIHGGVTTYFKNGIQVSDDVVSWTPESDGGKMGDRHKARSYKLTGTPVGMLTTGFMNYAYAAHLAPSTAIGRSIMNGAAVIYSVVEDVSYSFNTAGVFKPANLFAGPTATVFEAMDWLAMGNVTSQPTSAAFLRSGGSFTADTTYDETKIVSDIYSAAIGSRTTPYNAMGSMTGFKINFTQEVALVPVGDVGWADAILKDITLTASFVPSNLTEAQVDALLAIQNTTATLPGQEYAKGVSGAKENLVITGTQIGWVFTAMNVGAKKQARQYLVGQHRHKEIEWANGPTYTAGVRNPYFAFTAPS